jgi:phage shock protein E
LAPGGLSQRLLPDYIKSGQLISLWSFHGWSGLQHVSKRKKVKNNMVEKIIQNGEGTIIDVRTRAEFQSGHAAGSINIPVSELMQRIDEVKLLESPLVLCCASGGRSSMASHLLKQQGIACHDAGPWLNVNYLQSQSVSKTA